MSALMAIVVGVLGSLPLFGMVWFWERHPRRRGRGLVEALCAIIASMLVVFLAGTLLGPLTSGVPLAIPLIIGGMVLALALNRMVQDEVIMED